MLTLPRLWSKSQRRGGATRGLVEETAPGPEQTTGGEELSGTDETPGGHSVQHLKNQK